MEEDGDDLDNLFDEYESNDPQPQTNANNENAENDAADPEKVPVPKRIVKRPRLKFNPERLCGKRGIPILVDHFKDVKFKGKGHEKEDLNKLLTTLELWTHRLFPSMKFEDCLRQIEHLGKKRPVKTCVQKIRLDFPILDSDFVRNEDEEEEHDQPNELEPEPPTDAFDRLFDDYGGNAQPVLSSTTSSSQSVGNVLGTSFGVNMSEEQKKRMEYNKMLAIERRKARMSAMQSNILVNSTENDSNVESVLNSPPTERRVNNDANFLFNYLEKQFTNTEYSVVDEKTKKKCSQSMELKDRNETEMDEIMESVDEVDKDETDHDLLSNVRNKDFAEDNGKEELGLEELMDLVDETDHDAMSNVKNDEGKCSQSMDRKESEIIESIEGDKDETGHDVLSNFQNRDCVNNNNAELVLDELMDLVDEVDTYETDNDAMSVVKNDKGKCSQSMELKGRKESERVESVDEDDNDRTGCNTLSNVQNDDSLKNDNKAELGLYELVDETHQVETCDVTLSVKNSVSSDKDEHFVSGESKAKVIDEKANEIVEGFHDQHTEKTDDEF